MRIEKPLHSHIKVLREIPLEELSQKLKDKKLTYKLKDNFSLKEFNLFLRLGFLYGSTTKILFVNQETYKHLQTILKEHLLKKGKDTKLYIHFVSPFGLVNIIEELKFKEDMCLVDMEKIKVDYYIKNHLLAIIE